MRWCRALCIIGLVVAQLSIFGQTVKPIEWGPWRYTDYKTTGIEFRSRCVLDSDHESSWEFQFRSRHDQEVDFGWRVERGVKVARENAFDRTTRANIRQGEY